MLLEFFLKMDIFPEDIRIALQRYVRDPAASSCSDHHLARALKKYDRKEMDHVQHLEDLPRHAVFKLHASSGKLMFRKEDKIRTRFRCTEVNSERVYFVNPLAEVVVETKIKN